MQTIPGVLKQTAHKNPDLPAIVDNGTTISYRDLQHQVLKVAAALQAKGLSKEDKFAIWHQIVLSGLSPRLPARHWGACL